MSYAKIVVKNNYEKRGDLVLRSYIRALKKINANVLLNNDEAVIYGEIGEDGKFYELFTRKMIDYDYYVFVSPEDVSELNDISLSQMYAIRNIIDLIIFGKKTDLDLEVSSIEDLAKDRAIEFDAYNNYLSRINPYTRLDKSDELEEYNAYNNFMIKIRELKKMHELDREEDFDEYDLNNYENISKVLVRK